MRRIPVLVLRPAPGRQAPAEQTCPAAHFTPQSPQLLGSVATAGNFQVLDSLNLHHDEAVDKAGGMCQPPGSGGGGGGGTCNSCKDCGNRPCLNGTCGACTTNADCCAPLGCSNGQCISIIHIG